MGYRAGGSCRVERHASGRAQRRNVGEGAVQVGAGLGVHDQALAAGLHVLGSHQVGSQHHQMSFERNSCERASGGDHIWAEGEVGHELPIHHVPLNAIDASSLQGSDFVTEAREVGG